MRFEVLGQIKKRKECAHTFIPVSWKTLGKDEGRVVTQFMCQHCLQLLNADVTVQLQQAINNHEAVEMEAANKAQTEALIKKEAEHKVVDTSKVDLDSLPADVKEAIEDIKPLGK